MSRWLGPKEIQSVYSIPRTTSYEILKAYEENGGQVIHIGSMRRVEETSFTEWLLQRGKHENS
jgi:hypothetical protein